jgi:putative Holliday junction resolvase
MKLLGIDYGRRKIGLALGDTDTKFAEPLIVIRFESEDELLKKVGRVIQEEQVKEIVMGVSEGMMAQETKEFGKTLAAKLGTPIIYQDETLTTHEAQSLSIKAGINRKKRKLMEDAYSATLILQAYLDNL